MTKSTKVVSGFVLLAVVVAVVGGGLWWFLRDDAPARVDLDTAARSVEGQDQNGTTTPAADGIAGTWTVDADSGSFDFDSATGTFAGFRIEEELAGVGSTTAVGRTGAVSGTLTIDGTTVTEGEIEVDFTSITTNDRRRDDQVARALQTSQFPTGTFVLTEPIELGAAAADGETVTATAVGDLTIHGVTRAVEWPIEARLVSGTIVAVGSLDITFSDFDVQVPSAAIVLSVEDHGIVEFQLLFGR